MCYIDVHTHHGCESDVAVCNLILGRYSMPEGEGVFSAGIHPWYIPDDWLHQLDVLEELLEHDKRVVAVGECGLDSLAQSGLPLQREVFLAQCRLAEKWQKPLIIHVVKAHSELLALRKQLSPSVPWVIHGFRGKPELARQYVSAGCYLSFGARFNALTPPSIPADRMLLETDESDEPIGRIAEKIALSCQITSETLKQRTVSNAQRLFFGNRDCLFR